MIYNKHIKTINNKGRNKMNKFTTAQLKAAIIEMNSNTDIDNAAFDLALNELENRMTESDFVAFVESIY